MRYRPVAAVPTLCLILGAGLSLYSQAAPMDSASKSGGGAACVVAKKLGNSLDLAWVIGAPSVDDAINQAKKTLRQRGHPHVFAQANSHQTHGWMVILKTQYLNARGRSRTSYGCGFSPLSAATAEQNALSDLRSYSWGWRAEFGYQIIETQSY